MSIKNLKVEVKIKDFGGSTFIVTIHKYNLDEEVQYRKIILALRELNIEYYRDTKQNYLIGSVSAVIYPKKFIDNLKLDELKKYIENLDDTFIEKELGRK